MLPLAGGILVESGNALDLAGICVDYSLSIFLLVYQMNDSVLFKFYVLCD